MSQVALYRGQGAESVYVGDNGAVFTNIGPDIVYYGDQNVSSTVYTGSIAVGASVGLTGSPYLVLAPTAARAYVNVAATSLSAGNGPTGRDVGTTLGETTIIDGNPVIEFSSAWGINTDGNPYFDDTGASPGESAFLVLATDGTLNLIQPEGVTP